MTLEEIIIRVADIKRLAEVEHDNADAHVAEDDLMKDFIRYVATSDTPLGEKAKLILQIENLDYDRWYE